MRSDSVMEGTTMMATPRKLVLTCTGHVTDADLEERLAKIQDALQKLSRTGEYPTRRGYVCVPGFVTASVTGSAKQQF